MNSRQLLTYTITPSVGHLLSERRFGIMSALALLIKFCMTLSRLLETGRNRSPGLLRTQFSVLYRLFLVNS